MTNDSNDMELLLAQRARRLAEVRTEDAQQARRELVFFTLGPELLALDASSLHGVLAPCAVVPLPEAPPQLLGLVQYQGEPLPVFMLQQDFGLPLPAVGAAATMLIIGREQPELALQVDSVVGQHAIQDRELHPMTTRISGFCTHNGRDPGSDGVFALVDAAVLLEDSRFCIAAVTDSVTDNHLPYPHSR